MLSKISWFHILCEIPKVNQLLPDQFFSNWLIIIIHSTLLKFGLFHKTILSHFSTLMRWHSDPSSHYSEVCFSPSLQLLAVTVGGDRLQSRFSARAQARARQQPNAWFISWTLNVQMVLPSHPFRNWFALAARYLLSCDASCQAANITLPSPDKLCPGRLQQRHIALSRL